MRAAVLVVSVFFKQHFTVTFGGTFAGEKFFGNLFIGVPVCHQLKYLQVAFGKLHIGQVKCPVGDNRKRYEPVEKTQRQFRTYVASVQVDMPNGEDEFIGV